jgi:hypothetical protein
MKELRWHEQQGRRNHLGPVKLNQVGIEKLTQGLHLIARVTHLQK